MKHLLPLFLLTFFFISCGMNQEEKAFLGTYKAEPVMTGQEPDDIIGQTMMALFMAYEHEMVFMKGHKVKLTSQLGEKVFETNNRWNIRDNELSFIDSAKNVTGYTIARDQETGEITLEGEPFGYRLTRVR